MCEHSLVLVRCCVPPLLLLAPLLVWLDTRSLIHLDRAEKSLATRIATTLQLLPVTIIMLQCMHSGGGGCRLQLLNGLLEQL